MKSFVTQDKLGLELYRLSRNFDEKIKDAKKSLGDKIGKKIAIAERRLNGNLLPKVQVIIWYFSFHIDLPIQACNPEGARRAFELSWVMGKRAARCA